MSAMHPMTERQLERRAETLELLNSEISASLERQAASGGRVDNKAVLLVGYAGAAASFLATRHAQPILAAVAYAAFAATAVLGLLAYSVRLYQDVPEPRHLFSAYLKRSRPQTLAALAATRVQAFEGNVASQARKARRWWLSLACLALGMVLMILALAVPY
jgi:multidrug transporter EmrE-like cation transporter